jgi:hypothetical protein
MIRMKWRGWLRQCATRRNVAGLILDGVIGILIDIILPVYLACNRNKDKEFFLGGKGGPCLGLIILPLSCADYL